MPGSVKSIKKRRGGKNLLKSKIVIFTGSFGSGKTEIAINQSIDALKRKEKVILADLDIVNPYFRSRDMRDKLKKIGIEVVAPQGKLVFADFPVIPPEIKGMIQGENHRLFIDLGGDDVGARSIAGFYNILKDIEYEMIMVINPYRPFTQNTEEITKLLKAIEISSRLKVNSLISNPHLEEQTNLEIITKGHDVIKKVSEQLNLPIKYLVIEESIHYSIGRPSFTENILNISRYMNLPWDESENRIR